MAELDTDNQFDTVEDAFGYQNDDGEFMLVPAILKEKDSDEYSLVGATGTNYGSTNKLQVMNYREAMATVNCEKWEKAIKLKHKKMVKYNVFQVVNNKVVPKGTKLMNFTWAMKKKSNGVYRA